MAKKFSNAATNALAATGWDKADAMTDADIARQIASNPDAAPDVTPEINVRHPSGDGHDSGRIRRRLSV